MRGRLAVALAAAIGLAPAAVRADDTKRACVEASEKGQSLRDEHKLRAAREALVSCSREACPGPLRKDCSDWLAGVDKAMPTVVFVAREGGRDVVRVAVDVDGARIAETMSGVAVPLDPGPHVVRFTPEGRAPVEQPLVAREGEKDRLFAIDLAAPAAAGPRAVDGPAPPPADASGAFKVPVPAWVLGGVAVAGGVSFAIFGLTGKSDLAHLRDTCGATHSCSQSSVDSVHTKLLVADVSLYTGIAALAGAAVVTILANRGTAKSTGRIGAPLVVAF